MKIKKLTKKDIIEHMIAFCCISIGIVVGVFSYVICLVLNLSIFGWNIGLLISPIVAGYVETFLANKFLKETTGAISAFVLFLVTIIYGFILHNPTLGGNLITFGTFWIILQAALPTLVNYFLIVFILSLVSHSLGIFKRTKKFINDKYNKLMHFLAGRPIDVENETEEENVPMIEREPIDLDNLGVLFITSKKLSKNIEYKGIYEANELLVYDEMEMLKLEDYDDKNKILIKDIRYTKEKTLLKLANSLKKDGYNGVCDIDIKYDTISQDKCQFVIQIAIYGTGMVIK